MRSKISIEWNKMEFQVISRHNDLENLFIYSFLVPPRTKIKNKSSWTKEIAVPPEELNSIIPSKKKHLYTWNSKAI